MTPIEWLENQIIEHKKKYGIQPTQIGYMNLLEEAKAMYEKEINKQILIIDDIDTELALIEDYAKGEVGEAITKLRKKISYDISRKIND